MERKELMTTNTRGDIVSGSRVIYRGIICDVGEVHRDTVEIMSRNFRMTVERSEVEKV